MTKLCGTVHNWKQIYCEKCGNYIGTYCTQCSATTFEDLVPCHCQDTPRCVFCGEDMSYLEESDEWTCYECDYRESVEELAGQGEGATDALTQSG